MDHRQMKKQELVNRESPIARKCVVFMPAGDEYQTPGHLAIKMCGKQAQMVVNNTPCCEEHSHDMIEGYERDTGRKAPIQMLPLV